MDKEFIIKAFDLNLYKAKRLWWDSTQIKTKRAYYKGLRIQVLKEAESGRGYASIKLKDSKNRIITENSIDYRLILIMGHKGEQAWLQENDLIIKCPMTLTIKETERWSCAASAFFRHILIDVEVSTPKKDFKRITKKPYSEFDKLREKGFLVRYIETPTTAPWGLKIKLYLTERDKWIREKYKIYLKKNTQEECYEKISDELQRLALKTFGDWPHKEISPKTGKWRADERTRNPLALKPSTIELIIKTQ